MCFMNFQSNVCSECKRALACLLYKCISDESKKIKANSTQNLLQNVQFNKYEYTLVRNALCEFHLLQTYLHLLH